MDCLGEGIPRVLGRRKPTGVGRTQVSTRLENMLTVLECDTDGVLCVSLLRVGYINNSIIL